MKKHLWKNVIISMAVAAILAGTMFLSPGVSVADDVEVFLDGDRCKDRMCDCIDGCVLPDPGVTGADEGEQYLAVNPGGRIEIDCIDGCVLPDPGIGSSVVVYGTIDGESDPPRIYGTIEIDCIDGCVLPDPGVAAVCEADSCVDGCVLPDE